MKEIQSILVEIDSNSLKKIEYEKDIEYNLPDNIVRKTLHDKFGKVIGLEISTTKRVRTYYKLYGEYFYNWKNFLEYCKNCGHYLTLENITRDIGWEPRKIADVSKYICENCKCSIDIEFEDINMFLAKNNNNENTIL